MLHFCFCVLPCKHFCSKPSSLSRWYSGLAFAISVRGRPGQDWASRPRTKEIIYACAPLYSWVWKTKELIYPPYSCLSYDVIPEIICACAPKKGVIRSLLYYFQSVPRAFFFTDIIQCFFFTDIIQFILNWYPDWKTFYRLQLSNGRYNNSMSVHIYSLFTASFWADRRSMPFNSSHRKRPCSLQT